MSGDLTIREAVLDPKFSIGGVSIGGAPAMPFLRITHPRHGDLDFLIPPVEMRKLADLAAKVST